MLRNLVYKGVEMMPNMFNKAWQESKETDDWKLEIITSIFEKRDNRNCANYRGITLLSVVSKTYEYVLEKCCRTTIKCTKWI